MKKFPLWMRILIPAIVTVGIEIALLLYDGPVTFERSERWKAFLLFIPFVVAIAAIFTGIWRSVERASSRSKRIVMRAIAGFYTSVMAFVLAAIAWFILFR